jgi:hypothetical protein
VEEVRRPTRILFPLTIGNEEFGVTCVPAVIIDVPLLAQVGA